MQLIQLIGQRFGRWTVLSQAERKDRVQIYWVCRCDCGTEKEIAGYPLRNGESRSCGCIQFALPLQRFWRLLEIKENGCWEWLGAVNRYGYGQFEQGLAHRWAFLNFIGPIPEGEQLDHLCRNRACVNPNHLEPVTLRENLIRGARSNQYKDRTHCSNGHEYTEENILRSDRGARICRICLKGRNERIAERARERRRAITPD